VSLLPDKTRPGYGLLTPIAILDAPRHDWGIGFAAHLSDDLQNGAVLLARCGVAGQLAVLALQLEHAIPDAL
jgi:hypothetical protein